MSYGERLTPRGASWISFLDRDISPLEVIAPDAARVEARRR